MKQKYNDIKYTIFDVISMSSRSIITAYLKRISKNHNVDYNTVVLDFNDYTYNLWGIDEEIQ